MRLNNCSARLVVNQWLESKGLQPIHGDKSFTEFATELRRVTAPKQVQANFVDRASAVRYIRQMAHQLPNEPA